MLEFCLLGPMRVVDRTVTVPITAAKQRAILAVLLTRAGKTVSTDDLIHQLWESSPPSSARNTLQSHIGRLRRALTVPELITTEPDGYRIRADGYRLDLREFEELFRRAKVARSAEEFGETSRLLVAALELWRGPAFADVPAHGLHRELVPALEEQRLQAHELLAEAEIQLGRPQDRLTDLRELAAANPLRERLWFLLMLALARSRRIAEALATYHQAATQFRRQLGADPGPDLRRLHEQLLETGPASPTGVDRRPPIPRTTLSIPDVPDFSGRQDVVAEVTEYLGATPNGHAAPIVAVSGQAGVGKTALAVRLGHALDERFPDGRVQLDLRGYSGTAPMGAAEALASLLTVFFAPRIPDDLHERVDLFHALTAGKRVLFVYDNVVDAEQILPLLPRSSTCAGLVTSRGPLPELTMLYGARPVALTPMSEAESLELVRAIVGPRRLTEERAELVQLARECHGIPLALRVAASRLACSPPDWPASRTVEALREAPLNALRLSPNAEPCVRVALDHSYRLLNDGEQRFFGRLGSLGREVFSFDEARNHCELDSLTTERLLYRLESHGLLNSVGYRHYVLPPLVRAYSATLPTQLPVRSA